MKIFGEHDEKTIAQFEQVRAKAVDAALMADGHVGYVMPIGGVAAYRNQVSVVGVGFDIACVAAGTPVSTGDGYTRPIEQITPHDRVLGWNAGDRRPVTPHAGAVARGTRDTVRVTLADGTSLRCTPDHRLMTAAGWKMAGALSTDDAVLASPYRGLPYEPYTLPAAIASWPYGTFRASPREWAAVVRLLGFALGDGHFTRKKTRACWYVYNEADAERVVSDVELAGARAHVFRRTRAHSKCEEHCVSTSDTLADLLEALGLPRGAKRGRWDTARLEWIVEQPAWVRAQLVDGFASADMTTPYLLRNGRPGAISLVQSSTSPALMEWWQRLLASLDIPTSLGVHARTSDAVTSWRLQVVGGEDGLMTLLRTIPWTYAAERRRGAARVASVIQQRRALGAIRRLAIDAAMLRRGTMPVRALCSAIATEYGVPASLPFHALCGRGAPRVMERLVPKVHGDCMLVAVCSIDADTPCDVYDVVTGDPAESFIASGVVAHNCGNAAIRTDMTLADLGGDPERVRKALSTIADEIADTVSFGVGLTNRAKDAPVHDPLFDDPAWDAVPEKYRKALRVKARQQLGTVGSGNHYVDVFADEDDTLWVGVHFGSRGFGHTVASGFLAMGQGKDWAARVPETEVLLNVDDPIGHDYWHLMNLAGRYAYVGREWVARKVVALLGAREMELVHNHHNFSWREVHDGEEVIVVRKGATPAFPGQKGFIGGSMGDDAVIVQGVDARAAGDDALAETQRQALYSTVHGAGRVMSRTQAAGKRNRRTGAQLSPGLVTPEMMKGWLAEKGVILRGGGLDESPHAYRRLPEVLAAQERTVEVLHTLRPLVVAMAGPNEFDPYKD